MKITIRNLQKKIPVTPLIRATIRKAILKASASQKTRAGSAQIAVCLVNNKKIRELNSRYLGKAYPTDVIAFDLGDKPGNILADIIVSTDTVISNSEIFKTSPLYELYLYVVHGVLHLLGYDDTNVRQRQIMQKKAELILKSLNISFS